VAFIHSEARDFTYNSGSDLFEIKTSDNHQIESRYLIGAYGKRSRIDKDLDRGFINRRSPWVGVKYHLKYDVPADLITLHNFPGGYCGISQVEDGIINLCYLTSRENVLKSGDIPTMEKNILSRNPFLEQIFGEADFLFDKPLVINEISFEPKSTVENGMIMIGDSAGLIAPLCGNGMAMAMHAGKILSDIMIREPKLDRSALEMRYNRKWRSVFSSRLWMGRNLQKMFGKLRSSNGLVTLMKFQPRVARFLINKTHGKEI
jgi:flavin-dependent dehydrogenase